MQTSAGAERLLIVSMLALVVMVGCGGDQRSPERKPRADAPRVETVAGGLEIPWEMAFLPDGRALITERPGRVRLLSTDGKLQHRPVASVEVLAVGEGGLLGLAVDPDFKRNHLVYLYRTTEVGNQIVRYRFESERLIEDRVIVDGIPAGAIHNGGRLNFGPDGHLYAATGDAGDSSLAQDPASLGGKFLRLDPRTYRGGGGRPEIYTSGHRNPQGFDWEPGSDRLFATEHGELANDELNLIERGENNGWPEVEGAEHGPFTAPVRVYTDTTVAPSGASFVTQTGSAWRGSFVVAALRGEELRRFSIDGRRVSAEEALVERDFGRLRTVVEGPDGALYVLTSNRDGRGTPHDGDDRILRIHPPRR